VYARLPWSHRKTGPRPASQWTAANIWLNHNTRLLVIFLRSFVTLPYENCFFLGVEGIFTAVWCQTEVVNVFSKNDKKAMEFWCHIKLIGNSVHLQKKGEWHFSSCLPNATLVVKNQRARRQQTTENYLRTEDIYLTEKSTSFHAYSNVRCISTLKSRTSFWSTFWVWSRRTKKRGIFG